MMQLRALDYKTLCEEVFLRHASNEPRMASIKEKYIEDCKFTLDYLMESLNYASDLTFHAYMDWFGELAYFLNFDLLVMKQHFNHLKTTLEKHLSQPIPLLDQGIKHFEDSYRNTSHTEQFLVADDVFLDKLLHMKSEEATEYIVQKAKSGMPVKDIYLHILQPTLYKIGVLWQRQVISVAKEHYATAVIQHIIGQLYPFLFNNKKSLAYSFTGVCVGKELHEIGMRMVTDFFEMEGYDTYYLGSNLPVKAVIAHLRETPTNILGISATTPMQLNDVRELINQIQSDAALKHIKILVGGRAFNNDPMLLKRIGADGYAKNAEEAIALAASWLKEA